MFFIIVSLRFMVTSARINFKCDSSLAEIHCCHPRIVYSIYDFKFHSVMYCSHKVIIRVFLNYSDSFKDWFASAASLKVSPMLTFMADLVLCWVLHSAVRCLATSGTDSRWLCFLLWLLLLLAFLSMALGRSMVNCFYLHCLIW